MGWKEIWARLAPKVISLSTSMEGTSPYTTEKSEAISSGDKDTLRNIQDKEGSLARKAAAAQLGLAVAPQILPIIANPATASTTAGAIAATGLDAAGLVGGLSQLNNYWNNRKNLTWNDTPGIILNGLSLVPGSSQLTNVKNWGTAANSVSNLIKPITSTVKANILARHIRINHPNLVQNLSQTGEHSQSLARIWNNYTGQNIKIDPKLIENAEKVQAALLYGPEKTLVPSARLYGFGTKNLSRMGIDDSVIQTISGTASKYPSQASKKLIAAQNLPDNVTFYSGPKIKSLQQIGHGQEHEVYQYGDDVLKFRFHRNPISYSPHNKAYSTLTDELTSTGAYKYKGPAGEFIPERQYLGVGIDDGGSLVPVFKERFVEGQTPTQQQLNEAFTKYGINYDGVKQVTFKDGSVAQDVNPKNVKLVDGKPIIIDPIAGSLYNPNFRHYKFKSKQVLSGSRPISEAERLGIPKGERSNPKALEDPYYWGYQQWNNRYNTAVNSENIQEAQRLRDLHFKIKAPNAPQYNFYHGTFNKERPFYIFEPQSNNELFFHFSPYKDTAEKFMGIAKTRNENGRLITAKLNIQHPTTVTDSGWWNWYRIPEANPRISKMLRMDGPTAGQYYSNLLLKEPSMSEANGKMMDMLGNDAFMYKNYTEDTGRISVAIPRPSQIKLADPITRTDTGEIIPIVKRDNFRNPDIRYKQGGIIKAQNGKVIGWNPSQVLFPKRMFELVAKRSNGAQTKSIPTIIKDVITGRDKSFYNYNNINGSNEIDTYLYGVPYNSEFTGDVSVGPDYTNYINKNYPNRNIKTYNAHFGDTLYIDDKAKPLVEKQLNNGEVVGGSMGRYAHAPSYIVTKEEGRPYDAGGHLIKFGRDKNENIVANMSDIYDFLPEDFEEKYNQTENPSWTRNLANNIGTPFIVRQNNIPVRFKEIVPEYKTDLQRELGDFLSQWGNTYDLKLPLSLSDEQIQEIFDGRDYGDDILDFMISKGYIKPVYKSGGIVKGQNGFLNTWQKAYNSKFGKGLRSFLNGTDSDLSDEEYLEKHGYNKPVGSIGILGALVAPEWEGLEALPVAENFGRTGTVKAVPKTAQMRPTKIKNFEGVPQVSKVEPVKELTKFEKFLQKPIKEQDDIVRFWNGEKFSNMEMLKLDKKAYQQFKNWINK